MKFLIKSINWITFFGLLPLILINYSYAIVHNTNYYNELYSKLTEQTQDHIDYLSNIGFAERAKGIKVNLFKLETDNLTKVDLSSFQCQMEIPQEVIDFDCNLKNTLITTDPTINYNKPEDLQKILDIRLYPVLRNLIKQHKTELFLGTKQEMAHYYDSKRFKILFEFIIPSSAIYYLAESSTGEFHIIMAGLVSKENSIAQLLTLKLAGIKIETIKIIGETKHFIEIVKKDISTLINKLPLLNNGNNVLIIAGCGLENTVSNIINQKFEGCLEETKIFKGDIISLLYHPLAKPLNDIHGFISLHLNYGEIVEEIIKLLLKNCKCKYVFSGGAGGYISSNGCKQKPSIGDRIKITQSMNELGETVALQQNLDLQSIHDTTTSTMHLHIASIFLETYEWLKIAQQHGNSVDVETFYIIRAIQNYNLNNPDNLIKADCGYFVSDYVGEKPLREYSNVYKKYPDILSVFLKKCYS